jgi:hypothetical protein
MIAKRTYRLIVTILTISYMIYHLTGDFWQMFIVPAGEVPLILMWALNVTHIIGMFCFVVISCCNCARKKFLSFQLDAIERNQVNDNSIPYSQTWRLTISIIFIQVS